MGLGKWLDNIKKSVDDKRAEEEAFANNPEAQRDQKREDNAKALNRATRALKIAQKGMGAYNAAAEKAGELKDRAIDAAGDLAEKAKPAAEKIDAAAGKAGDTLKGIFGAAKDKIAKGASAAGDKIKSLRGDGTENTAAETPADDAPKTRGGGLLGWVAPAVPEEALKPQTPDADKGAAETPKAPPAGPSSP